MSVVGNQKHNPLKDALGNFYGAAQCLIYKHSPSNHELQTDFPTPLKEKTPYYTPHTGTHSMSTGNRVHSEQNLEPG